MAKIGILGGTFDPIHNGHLELGKQAYEQFGLDQIWFMPSGNPPHKKNRRITEGTMRQDMILLAISDTPGFVYSDFELKREGNTYTAQTLSLLHEVYPQHEFYFIVGADSLYQIENWFHPELVMKQTILLAAVRPCHLEHREFQSQIRYLTATYGARIEMIHFREMNISSEEVRRIAGEGLPLEPYVPAAVADYIKSHGLYQEPADVSKELI